MNYLRKSSKPLKLPTLECKRCGHRWIPRVVVVRICPRCKSAYWNVPRKKRNNIANAFVSLFVFFLTILLVLPQSLALIWNFLPVKHLVLDKPNIYSSAIYPVKIREHEILSFEANISDMFMISKVLAEIEHEQGYDREELYLVKGNRHRGTWRGIWHSHDLKNQKWYNLTIIATDIFGNSASVVLRFQDPVQNHSASEITAGTFDYGDFIFPNQLNVSGNFYVNSTNPVLFVNASSGKVGIGTMEPGAKLEVVGGKIKATDGLIIETRTSDPTSPVTGQIWLRTDI